MSASYPVLEICVDCMESIVTALAGGANRLELCSALSEGGLTPSLGLVKTVRLLSPIPVFIMIRQRGGDFVYERDELEAMVEDIRNFKELAVDGFVFGALTRADEVDEKACRKVIEGACPLPVTFHRAFDDVADPIAALEKIRELGFARILTSGQKKTAEEGIELIAKLVKQAEGKIIIMPGAGITQKNIRKIKDETGAKEFHASAKRIYQGDGDKFRVGSNEGRAVTDADVVRLMIKVIRDLI